MQYCFTGKVNRSKAGSISLLGICCCVCLITKKAWEVFLEKQLNIFPLSYPKRLENLTSLLALWRSRDTHDQKTRPVSSGNTAKQDKHKPMIKWLSSTLPPTRLCPTEQSLLIPSLVIHQTPVKSVFGAVYSVQEKPASTKNHQWIQLYKENKLELCRLKPKCSYFPSFFLSRPKYFLRYTY